ncbi:MAG: hypothetical protein AB7U44_01060 [Sulfuricurvum sp.]
MVKKITLTISTILALNSSSYGDDATAWELFNWMEDSLSGRWVLAPADAQVGTNSYKHPAVLPLVGTNVTGIAFKLIGGEVTIQEDLLPDTTKQMVTMYHCKDIACTNLKATHYCSKQNQPEFLADLQHSTPKKIIFDCDMSTELCQSDEDHVHQIIHEISDDGSHLKSSYLSWENKHPKTDSSIYYFDRPKD